MKNFTYSRNGFTLVELLVVVLIIGILSAVALPKYQMAVVKSKVANILPIMKTVWEAQELRIMQQGSFSNLWEDLDVNLPSCTHNASTNCYACGKEWMLNLTTDGLAMASYCPGKNTNYNNCRSSRDFLIDAYSTFAKQNSSGTRPIGKIACEPVTALGQKVCTALLASGQVEHKF